MSVGRLAGGRLRRRAGGERVGDDLSPEEFGAAYRDLSRDDRKKLVVIAKRLCGVPRSTRATS